MFCLRIVTSQRVKNISSYTHKTGSRYLFGALYKISDEHPVLFISEFPRDFNGIRAHAPCDTGEMLS